MSRNVYMVVVLLMAIGIALVLLGIHALAGGPVTMIVAGVLALVLALVIVRGSKGDMNG